MSAQTQKRRLTVVKGAPAPAATASAPEQAIVPFHTYIFKLASRCNLNCSYCFVYNQADSQWKRQPRLMSEATMRQAATRMVEHCLAHGKREVSVSLHGGEPLLGGVEHLRTFLRVVDEVLRPAGILARVGVQTNGLLLTDAVLDLCLEKNVAIGVSLDGPPDVQDRYRFDHAGRGSSARLEPRLRALAAEKYRSIFCGFLVVAHLEADPIATFEYLADFRPPQIDILLPYDNHDRRPAGKERLTDAPYGAWMRRLFDHWLRAPRGVEVREFQSLLRLLLSGRAMVDAHGLGPVDIVVVETNGEIEGEDSLKATYDGATSLGLDVFAHAFDDAARHVAVVARNNGVGSLADVCRPCAYVKVCGGGYLPNRYSRENGFRNPTVYCSDQQLLIAHMKGVVTEHLMSAGVMT